MLFGMGGKWWGQDQGNTKSVTEREKERAGEGDGRGERKRSWMNWRKDLRRGFVAAVCVWGVLGARARNEE